MGATRADLDQRHQSAAEALEPASKLEFEQHGAHDGGRGARHPDEMVEQNGRWSQLVDNAGAIARSAFGSERLIVGLAQLSGRPVIGSTALMTSEV